jgi:hypothetical protein
MDIVVRIIEESKFMFKNPIRNRAEHILMEKKIIIIK